MPTYGSPWLIAVSRVLLRLPVPRHSPCALCSLTMCSSWFSKLVSYRDLLFEIVDFAFKILVFKYFRISSLYLLSSLFSFQCTLRLAKRTMVGSSGLEPPTSRLSGVCSNQLSYEPIGLRRPSTLPGSCPPSTIDRLGLNRRVRNGNGCVPQAHHHRRCFVCFLFCLKV